MFVDFKKKKNRILARLKCIQKNPFLSDNYLLNLSTQLTIEYKNFLKIEEDHRCMRSRINWINDRDANTKFYHISVINRIRRNNISFFKNNNEDWISNHLGIIIHTLKYFQNV